MVDGVSVRDPPHKSIYMYLYMQNILGKCLFSP